MDYGRMKIQKLKNFPLIMEKFDSVGSFMTSRDFHRDYVSKLEPSVSMNMWNKFMARHNRQVKIKADKVIERSIDKKVSEVQMEESSIRKILTITDLTLDAVVKKPELLESIPLGERMNWFFNTMKARDSRMTTMAKVNAEARKTSMYEDVLKGAQYGAIDEDAIDSTEGEFEEIKKPKKITTSEFSPNDLN